MAPKTDPYASIAEDPYAGIAEGATKPAPAAQKTTQQEGTAKKVGRGAAIGAFEGLGIPAATTPKDVIYGTFKNLSQGAKDLLVQTWESNMPKGKLGMERYDPLTAVGTAGRTALDIIPTFIVDTANQLEQNEAEFKQAIQQKDWERASQVAAKSVTTIAMLKHGAEKPESLAKTAEAGTTLGEKVRAQLRRTTEASYGAKEAVTKGIEKQTAAIEKNKTARTVIVQKNLERDRAAKTEIDREKVELAEANRRIKESNDAQAKQVAEHHKLAIDVDQSSVDLGKDIESLENKVYTEADKKFKQVKNKIGNPQADPSTLIGLVKDAEENVLRGIPENVKEFKRIVEMEATSDAALQLRNDTMKAYGYSPEDYDSLPPQARAMVDKAIQDVGGGTGPAHEPLTWDKLQSLKTRLDKRLRNARGMNGDLKRALFQVRDGVVDEMGKMATAGGAVADWDAARDFYRQWKEDFHEPSGPQGSGSPVAQAHDAVDPSKIRQPFSRTASAIGNRGLDILRKYPQFGGDLVAKKVETILAKQDQMDALPSELKPKELKQGKEVHQLPTPKEAPKIPAKPTIDIRKAARDRILATGQRVGRLNVWDARIVATSIIVGPLSLLLGHPVGMLVMAGPVYVAMKEMLSRAVERENVIKWLAEPTKAEIDSLNKLPGIDKVNVADGLTEAAELVYQKSGKKLKLAPEVRRLLGAGNVARLVKLGAVNAQRKPAEQLRDLKRITSSNPNLPVGEAP